MPKRVQLPDGNIGEFPDSMSDSQIEGVLQKQFPAKSNTAPSAAPTKPDGFLSSLTTMTHQSDTPVHAVEDVLGNIGASGIGALLHPIKTAEGFVAPIAAAMPSYRSGPFPVPSSAPIIAGDQLREQVTRHPQETIEQAIGQAGALSGAGELAEGAAGKVADVLPKAAESVTRTVTGTGPKTLKSLVKDTQTGQSASDAYSNVRSAIETAREKALKVGNEKYSTVNSSLNPIESDPEFMQGALADALESLKGSHTEPTILKQMTAKLQRGDAFTYEDLQGDYSRLGKELSKGTLPGDEYHAYDVLHEAIGDEMQRIADSEGQGPQLKAARDYWRRMKQTFGKPLPQTDAATSTLRSLAPDMAEQDTIANRIRLLGSFDPEIPKAFGELEKARAAAKDLTKPTPGETAKIGSKEIQEHKLKSLTNRAEQVRKVGRKIVNYGVGLKALWDAYHLNLGSSASDVALGVAGYKAADAFARLLEKPAVVEMLTKPTDADIAQIPPELRSNLTPMLNAAKAKGIKVDPRLYAVAGAAAPRKRVASALQPQ